MGGGGPQATRIPGNPVGSAGIADDGPARPPGPGPRGPKDRSARRLVSLLGPPLALMGLIWFLSAQPDLSSGLRQDLVLRKAAHVTEFGLLTVLWARALRGLWRSGGTLVVPAAAAIAVVWAAVDERHQHFVEGRVGTPRDVAIDAIGVVVAVALLRWTPLGVRIGVRRRDVVG